MILRFYWYYYQILSYTIYDYFIGTKTRKFGLGILNGTILGEGNDRFTGHRSTDGLSYLKR